MNIYRIFCLSLIFISVAIFASNKPEGATDEQWSEYIEHRASWDKMLKERYDNELKQVPPKPPWIKYPNRHPTDMFWRMGNGEDYLNDYFGLYFKYSSEADINAYKLKYPEHKDWLGTYEDFEN